MSGKIILIQVQTIFYLHEKKSILSDDKVVHVLKLIEFEYLGIFIRELIQRKSTKAIEISDALLELICFMS